MKGETRIIVVTPESQLFFCVEIIGEMGESVPITFYNPQECFDMLFLNEEEAKEENFEQTLGEKEMSLSFFTDAINWQ